MREILFRGKESNSGKWVYGYLWSKRTIGVASFVGNVDEVVVDPSTVGQYTGLTDKNGVKIFEGDVVQVPFWRSAQSGLVMKGVLEFQKAAFWITWEYQGYGKDFAGYIQDVEVIGNIHDNPELLK